MYIYISEGFLSVLSITISHTMKNALLADEERRTAQNSTEQQTIYNQIYNGRENGFPKTPCLGPRNVCVDCV